MSEYIRNVVEAALLAAGRPLQLPELAQLFAEADRPDAALLREALSALADQYEARGIEVKQTASGYRIQVRSQLAAEVSRLWPERPARYSRALLETLALIAYRQPITRAEIEAVRGVAVNPNILKTVIERGWVRVVGHREVPGRPELLGTTREFLDYFGLKNLDELPALAEVKMLGDPPPVQLELPVEGAPNSEAEGAEGPEAQPGADVPDEVLARAQARADEVAVEEAAETAAAEAAPPQIADPDPAADPPSPFVEAVIAPAAAVNEGSDEAGAEEEEEAPAAGKRKGKAGVVARRRDAEE